MSTPPSPREPQRCAERLRSEAKHARRLAATLHQETEGQRLIRYAEELEERATHMEQQAGGDRQADG